MLTGIRYPLEVDGVTGSIKTATDEDLIRGHILSWIETEPLERVMRPLYGTPGYIFTTQPQWGQVAALIESRLTANVPQSTFRVAGQISDDGSARLEVYWALQGLGEQEPIQVVIG